MVENTRPELFKRRITRNYPSKRYIYILEILIKSDLVTSGTYFSVLVLVGTIMTYGTLVTVCSKIFLITGTLTVPFPCTRTCEEEGQKITECISNKKLLKLHYSQLNVKHNKLSDESQLNKTVLIINSTKLANNIMALIGSILANPSNHKMIFNQISYCN